MNQDPDFRLPILKAKLQHQNQLYILAIQNGCFADAKAIKNVINQLQIDMDDLLPYISEKTMLLN